MYYSRFSESIEVGQILGWGHRLGNLVVIENDPATFLEDVADVVSRHSGGAHVTDEGHQPVLCKGKEKETHYKANTTSVLWFCNTELERDQT